MTVTKRKSCIRFLRVLLGKLWWDRTCKQKALGGARTTSRLPLLWNLASVSYFAVGKRQHSESRHQLLSEQATNHLSHFLSATLQVTLSLQAYWQKKQSNRPSSWHYQTYVTCTQAGSAVLASKQQSWAEGFPNTSGAGKLCLFLPINQHRLWLPGAVNQSRAGRPANEMSPFATAEASKVIARSRARATVNISVFLDFFQRQHAQRVHGTQNERWQDESTRRPDGADRTLDDLLFIQIKIFPSIKLLQRNVSDVSLSGVRCASFMRRYPLFFSHSIGTFFTAMIYSSWSCFCIAH